MDLLPRRDWGRGRRPRLSSSTFETRLMGVRFGGGAMCAGAALISFIYDAENSDALNYSNECSAMRDTVEDAYLCGTC